MISTLRSSAIGFVLLLSSSALAQPAEAPDPTTPEGKQAEGKVRYEKGADAYSQGRFKDAIDLFLQADALAPSAALSFNIARAYEKIGDDAATLQWFRDFRRRAPDAKNGPEVDDRIHQLEGVLAKKGVQQLTVLSSPLGATVIVDDQPVGVTPYTGQFAPGAHKVVLSLRGYADTQHQVQLGAEHAQDLSVPLVPAKDRSMGAATDQGGPAASGVQTGTSGTPAPPTDAAAGPRFGPWPWIGVGAGALALGASLGFELSRRKAEDDAKQDSTQVGYKESLDKMHSRQSTARVLVAVGGVLAITGGTLLVIDLTSRKKKAEPHAQLGLGCSTLGCNFDLQGQF